MSDKTMYAVTAILALGAACVVWGIIEARLYRTNKHTVEVLPEGSKMLRALQVSDLHFRSGQASLEKFVRSLGSESYDLVLATGDLLGDPASVDRCFSALNTLRAPVRCFVLGSSDYYAPKFKNYLDYFLGRKTHGTRKNPTDHFRRLLTDAGWIDLTNVNVEIDIGGLMTQVTGMDDPYLKRDDRSILHRDPNVPFALCVVHDPSPYLDVTNAGYDLMISGHTHGGQVRFPLIGAVVTNSKLPPRYARWATKFNGTWLFVSPGLGTGPYAPIRFMCPPEASVLELIARK